MNLVVISVLAALTVLCGVASYATAGAGANNPLMANFSNTCLFLMASGVTTLFVMLAK